jgi:anti-sigma B factor antagonist
MSTENLLNIEIEARDLDGTYEMVSVVGDLDIHTSPRLKEALYALIESGKTRLVLNFDGIRYMDSAGLGVLMGAQRRAREADGRILLICKSIRIQRLFIITGLTRVFDVFEDEEKMARKLNIQE